MARLIKDDFSPKAPITQVPSSWFNRVAKILNGIVGGMGIRINKDGTDTASLEIGLDPETARKCLGVDNLATVASNEPTPSSGTTPTDADKETLAATHPKEVGCVTNEETDKQKRDREIADIGTSASAARADHVHRLEHATQHNDNMKINDGGDSRSRLPTGYSLDANGWKRDSTIQVTDCTKSTTSDAITSTEVTPNVFAGIRFQVVSRVVRIADEDVFFWRWAYFDHNGMLMELSAEQGCYSEVNYDNY